MLSEREHERERFLEHKRTFLSTNLHGVCCIKILKRTDEGKRNGRISRNKQKYNNDKMTNVDHKTNFWLIFILCANPIFTP